MKPKFDPNAVPAPQRKPWASPQLRRLGSMTAMIQGGGKSGSNLDGDPRITFKSGTG